MIRIRETTRYRPRPRDATNAAALFGEAAAGAVAAFIAALDPQRDGAVFVEEHDELVGFAAFAGGRRGARLRWLAAAPHAHDAGLAPALLARCVRAAASQGHATLDALAPPASRPAAWLAEAGFRCLPQRGTAVTALWQRSLLDPRVRGN